MTCPKCFKKTCYACRTCPKCFKKTCYACRKAELGKAEEKIKA
jgi:hypothetical protein